MKKQLLFLLIAIVFSLSIAHAQSILYGVTTNGGNNFGSLYGMHRDSGTIKKLFTPDSITALIPQFGGVVEGSNGKLYGTTRFGGKYNGGLLYEVDPVTSVYTNKVLFNDTTGYGASGSLLNASNGKLYGLLGYGGSPGFGALFEYDPIADAYQIKYNFDYTNGSLPGGTLVEASNGKLYGIAMQGGTFNNGVVFEYDPSSDTFTNIVNIPSGSANGSNTFGKLVESSINGKFYGTFYYGGTDNVGVIYECDMNAGTFTIKYNFDNSGNFPFEGFAEAPNGKLYGIFSRGGINNLGGFYEYDVINNTVAIKTSNNSGAGAPVAINGKIYGMTGYNGLNYYGTLYEYDPVSDIFQVKYNFDAKNGGNNLGSLSLASNGKVYGVSSGGGLNRVGTIFEYDLNTDILRKMVDLGTSPDGSNFKSPPVRANNGNLYGISYEGGIHGFGVLYEYTIDTDVYTKKYDFDRTNGSFPTGYLMQASDNKLYGITSQGGTNNYGVIFEYDLTNNTYTNKYSFDADKKHYFESAMVEVSNGKLYGIVEDMVKGSTIFEYDITSNTYTEKNNFKAANHTGIKLDCSFMKASNGKLYGTTYSGGVSSMGEIFEYDPATNIYTLKYAFNGTMGSYPGALIQSTNGDLYGLTSNGGSNSDGTLFKYNYTTDTHTLLYNFDFTNTNLGTPTGALLEAKDGNLYGICTITGASYINGNLSGYNLGAVFEYNQSSGNLTKKMEFSYPIGVFPSGSLIEVIYCPDSIPVVTAPNTPVLCDGGNDGTATASATGGKAPYSYSWSAGLGSSPSVTGLSQGTYTITVTDVKGCKGYGNTTITGPLPIITSISSQTNVSCHGDSNGTAAISASGGTGAMHYSWAPSGGTNNIASNLAADTYTVTVKDDNNCSTTQQVIITEPTTINVSVTLTGTQIRAVQSGASYQWLYCNGYPIITGTGGNTGTGTGANNHGSFTVIAGANNQSYTITSASYYAVAISNGTCSDTSACYLFNPTATLDPTVNETEILLYPNPTSGSVTVVTHGNAQLDLYNDIGVNIYSAKAVGEKTEINMNDQSSGVYFMKISNDKGFVMKKILKQ